jgi:hypothetical protein
LKTNARIAAYTGESDVWKRTTAQGATIQKALDFAMTVPPSKSNETDGASELYSIVADVAVTYGDPDGKYIAFLKAGEPAYAADAFFLWDQPLPGGENGTTGSNATTTSSKSSSGGAMVKDSGLFTVVVGAAVASAVGSILGL